MLKLSDIITEADIRVPNSLSPVDKVTFLNEVNQEFFSVVKIPMAFLFSAEAGTAVYTAPINVRGKNIDLVIVGTSQYMSLQYDDLVPGRSFWVFDDIANTLTLTPAPISAGQGVARYYQMPVTTFLSTNLTANPDAPSEYHHIYVLGLSAKIAKAIPDVPLGNNYQNEYETQLQIAMQNYVRRAGK